MAWIESHQALEKHPKVYELMSLTGWDLDTAIGKLHRFWWWCVDYAEDGDLRKYSPEVIGRAMGLEGEKATQIVSIMVKAKWIDEIPYLRVHDWWDYIGLFLQRKYGEKKKDKWQHIQKLYSDCTAIVREGVQELTQPNQPNLTLPNQPNTFSSDSVEVGLAEKLCSLIRNRNPGFKKPNIQKWASEVDKMIRLDKRSPEEIGSVIAWCQADEFWQNNILSTSKLRKQYDQLVMKAKKQKTVPTVDERKRKFLGGPDG